jgi:16S rRNA G966 N2-methylase RsmD
LGFLDNAGHVFNLIFMDPPYDQGLAASTLHILDKTGLLSKEICIVVEHSAMEPLPEKGDRFIRTDHRRYGKALVSFYQSVL